jgi:hypothetical protein
MRPSNCFHLLAGVHIYLHRWSISSVSRKDEVEAKETPGLYIFLQCSEVINQFVYNLIPTNSLDHRVSVAEIPPRHSARQFPLV